MVEDMNPGLMARQFDQDFVNFQPGNQTFNLGTRSLGHQGGHMDASEIRGHSHQSTSWQKTWYQKPADAPRPIQAHSKMSSSLRSYTTPQETFTNQKPYKYKVEDFTVKQEDYKFKQEYGIKQVLRLKKGDMYDIKQEENCFKKPLTYPDMKPAISYADPSHDHRFAKKVKLYFHYSYCYTQHFQKRKLSSSLIHF